MHFAFLHDADKTRICVLFILWLCHRFVISDLVLYNVITFVSEDDVIFLIKIKEKIL